MSIGMAVEMRERRSSLAEQVRRMSRNRQWGEESAEEGGHWISLFFFLAGILALIQSGVAQSTPASVLLALAVVSFAAGTIGWMLPWARWGEAGLRWVPAVTSGFLALAFTRGPNAAAIAGLFALLAVWVGLFLPPFSGVRAAPWVLTSYAVPLLMRGEVETLLRSAATTVIVSIVVAEIISRIVLALVSSRGEAERIAEVFRATSIASRRMKTLNPDGVYRELVGATITMGFEAAAVNVVDRERGKFVVRSSCGFGAVVDSLDQRLTEGVSGRVLVDRALTIVEDYGHASYRLRDLDPDGLEIVAGVPIEIGGEVAAVLLACSRKRIQLPPYALDALEMLASDAAVALENAVAYQFERERANELAEVSLSDALTGLQNRRSAEAEIRTLSDDDCVLLIDLDHFKQINDSDGHAAGDAVLVRIGQFLRSSLRANDFAARWGGEEFLVILRGANEEGYAIAERLLEQWRATRPRTTFSAGIAIHRTGRLTADTLQIADAALYRAKRKGRDRLGFVKEHLSVA